MTPEQYCHRKAAASGSSFYYSFLFLPRDTRRAITALYAFCREVDDVVDECRNVDVAQQKLDWWRGEINAAFNASARHPVALELARLIEPCQLPKQYLHDIIDGMQMDLAQSRYADMDELRQYCYRAAGVVGLLAARLFGYENPATERYAHDLGLAFQLTNIIRDVREDSFRGRVYLPQDMLAWHGVTATDLQRNTTHAGLQAALQELATHADAYYQSAIAALPEVDRWNQRSGLIMSAIYRALLAKMRAADFNVMAKRVTLSKWSKLWTAWKTARYEYRRRQRYRKNAA